MLLIPPSVFYVEILPSVVSQAQADLWENHINRLRIQLLAGQSLLSSQKIYHPAYFRFLKTEIRQLDIYLLDLMNWNSRTTDEFTVTS